jgi:hypothetical protein
MTPSVHQQLKWLHDAGFEASSASGAATSELLLADSFYLNTSSELGRPFKVPSSKSKVINPIPTLNLERLTARAAR